MNRLINFRNDAKKIAATFGTPTYVVYERILKESYRHFIDSFKKNYAKVIVAYSIKTNYLPAILSILHSEGASMEAVSGFEVYLALKIGVPPNKIIFNGPAKTLNELDFAIKNDIFLINADSRSELKKIDKIGKKYEKVINVGIRTNIETITWKKFGIPLQYAGEAFKFSSRLKNVKVRGLHVHIGTKVSATKPYVWTLDKLLGLMRKIRKAGIVIDFLDIGGGFAVGGVGKRAYRNFAINVIIPQWLRKSRLRFLRKPLGLFISKNPVFPRVPTIETYAERICGRLKERLREYSLPAPLLITEPGRAIVSSAVMLLVSVVDVKNLKEKWVMVDGGINLVPSLEFAAHRFLNVTGKEAELEMVKLAGPLCSENDILCERVELPIVSEGDIMEIFDVGAYSISQSRQFIKPRAGAVLVREDGEIVEVRRRENYKDLISLDALTHAKPEE